MISLYEKYKIVKKSLSFDYKGYPIQNVLSSDIIALVFKKKKNNIRQLLDLFLIKKINLFDKNEMLFSIGDYNRRDYYELLDYVRTDIDSGFVDLSEVKKKPYLSIKNIHKSFNLVFNNNVDLDFTSKVFLMSKMTYSLNVIDYLDKQDNSFIKLYCSFCSNLNDETILDYYFQKRGVPTYTLQHGLWFIYEKPPIDAISYENMIADKLLCWGEYTKNEYIKFGFNDESLIVAGYPKKIEKLTSPIRSTSKTHILVLLSRVLFDENNMKLILLLASTKNDFDITLKLHPSLDEEKYSELARVSGFNMAPSKTVQELLRTEIYDCSISYNSTAYYDSYINNRISLRYKDIDADNAIEVLNDSFTNLDELMDKMELVYIGQREQSLWNDIEFRLEYILGYGINKYDILQNKK